MKKVSLWIGLFSLICILLFACSPKQNATITEVDAAHQWAEMTLYITKHTPANSPTFASRCLGYIGLTMYESIVHGYPEYQSMVGQLNGLDSLPLPDKNKSYRWIISLNAAQAEILQLIYQQTSDSNKIRIKRIGK
jgi:hypothetical protein